MPARPLSNWAWAAACAVTCGARPAAAGGGGDGVWWSYEHEYVHFECYVVIVLVVLALIVDTAHHRLSHMAQGAKAWRGDTADAHREVHRESQVPLWESLFANSVGELMVLGCVAAVVWSASRAGLFDAIAYALSSYDVIALPGDSSGYLHAVEDVHMQLFATMMLYISVMALTVRGTMRAEMLWEAADDKLATDQEDVNDEDSTASEPKPQLHVPEAVLEEFARTRKEFMNSIEDWRGGRWQLFDLHVEPLLQRLPERPCHVTQATESGEVKEGGETRTSTNDLLADWFPFDEYLALECRFFVHNLAEVKPMTWAFIMFSMLLKAQLLRETRSNAANYSFDALLMVALIIFVTASGWQISHTYRMKRKKEKASAKERAKDNPSLERHRTQRISKQASKLWKQKLNEVRFEADTRISYPWLTALNLLQIVLFYISFHIVRFTTLRQWWEQELARSIVCTFLALLGVPILGTALGMTIPKLSMVLARADFMQERHLQWLRVMLQDHCSGRDHAYNSGRRLSRNLTRGLASPHFEASFGVEVASRRISICSAPSIPSRAGADSSFMDPVTIVAARRAAAQERRGSFSQVLPASQDLPGCVAR